MKLALLVVLTVLSQGVVSENAYNNCADVGAQQYVSIDQLMGTWYGIEVISHRSDSNTIADQNPNTCLQIHISEDLSTTTVSSTYRDYNSDYNHRDYKNRKNYGNRYSGFDNYDTSTTSYYATRKHYHGRFKQWNQQEKKDEIDQRKLNILWFAAGDNIVKYTTTYMSAPGVWHISGPHNGSSLIEPLRYFAGTIQVLKAVGEHMVLTFCHMRPDQQLYTVILSRLPELKRRDVLSIHNMLTRKDLEIVSVKSVCTNDAMLIGVNTLAIILVAAFSVVLA